MLKIPAEIKLRAICLLDCYKINEFLQPYGFNHDCKKDLNYKEYFDVTQEELVSFLKIHPEICESLLNHSYDKRCSPSSFMDERKSVYRVGWFDGEERDIKKYEDFYEAAADYVLLSAGFPRLKR